MLAVLTGGTGGAKLIQGLSRETDPEQLHVICNTADDFVIHGLHVSPDVDTVTYTLAGIADPTKGWGVRDDTFTLLESLGRLGGDTWFRLGDRDLATHITRTELLREGHGLSRITERIRKALGVKSRIIPMSDDRVETRIVTRKGEQSFQEYFVRNHWTEEVVDISFASVENSRPAPAVLESIREASAVVICPSNPVTSIGPILAVPGIRKELKKARARTIAVSPIRGDAPFSGPAHKLMAARGMEVSAFGVAKAYQDFVGIILVASEDREAIRKIEELQIRAVATSIRMDSLTDRRKLAREVLSLA